MMEGLWECLCLGWRRHRLLSKTLWRSALLTTSEYMSE